MLRLGRSWQSPIKAAAQWLATVLIVCFGQVLERGMLSLQLKQVQGLVVQAVALAIYFMSRKYSPSAFLADGMTAQTCDASLLGSADHLIIVDGASPAFLQSDLVQLFEHCKQG